MAAEKTLGWNLGKKNAKQGETMSIVEIKSQTWILFFHLTLPWFSSHHFSFFRPVVVPLFFLDHYGVGSYGQWAEAPLAVKDGSSYRRLLSRDVAGHRCICDAWSMLCTQLRVAMSKLHLWSLQGLGVWTSEFPKQSTRHGSLFFWNSWYVLYKSHCTVATGRVYWAAQSTAVIHGRFIHHLCDLLGSRTAPMLAHHSLVPRLLDQKNCACDCVTKNPIGAPSQ